MKLKKITLGVLGVAVIAAPIATVVSCGKKTLEITIDYTKGIQQATSKFQNEVPKYVQEIKDGKYTSVKFTIITKNGQKTFDFDNDNAQQVGQEMAEFIKQGII